MSSQRGNLKKSGAQKHQNVKAFKNDLHDKTKKMQNMKTLNLGGICQRCKEKIEWKIKYRKYKPLTVPRTCVQCSEKTIKQAYYTLCVPCATAAGVCAKCAEKKEIVCTIDLSPSEQAAQDCQLKQELEMLSERKRRTFFRLQPQGKLMDLGDGPDKNGCYENSLSSDTDEDNSVTEENDLNVMVDNDSNEPDSHVLSHISDCDSEKSSKNNVITVPSGNVKTGEIYK